MRLSPSLLVLPALVSAQEQVPLKEQVQGWIEKAKTFLPAKPPVAPSPETQSTEPGEVWEHAPPVDPESSVTRVTMDNWQSLLAPVGPEASDKEREWLIFLTGGNNTCFGRCHRAEKAFNDSVPMFLADPTSPSLGFLNCEVESILCSAWSTGPPSLWHLQIPVKAEADQPKPKTPAHIGRLNATTVTPEDVYKFHSEKLWQNKPEYTGAFHPMDGWLSEYGLNFAVAYAIWALAAVPSWLLMIVISFFSRTIMSRRMGNSGAPASAPAPASGAAQ